MRATLPPGRRVSARVTDGVLAVGWAMRAAGIHEQGGREIPTAEDAESAEDIVLRLGALGVLGG
jgi:hypothetical protein